jgi:hypothetical protein
MLHACFTPIALCFVYTSWHFYAFSRTTLLTRCHCASSYFLLFLCFRKFTQEIFSELDEIKAKVHIYLKGRQSPEERQSRTRRWPHHRVARATPWPCHRVVWALGPPSDIALLPIYSFRRENPRGPNNFPRNILKSPLLSSRDQEGPEALPDTLPKRGIINEGLLHHHASLRSDA